MIPEHNPLSRQINTVFSAIQHDLSHLTSGIVFIHIRNNFVGKFGIRHDVIEAKNDSVSFHPVGLSEDQQQAFCNMVIQALKHKRGWTHGEIEIEFALRQSKLTTSILIESNYNMANIPYHRRARREQLEWQVK